MGQSRPVGAEDASQLASLHAAWIAEQAQQLAAMLVHSCSRVMLQCLRHARQAVSRAAVCSAVAHAVQCLRRCRQARSKAACVEMRIAGHDCAVLRAHT